MSQNFWALRNYAEKSEKCILQQMSQIFWGLRNNAEKMITQTATSINKCGSISGVSEIMRKNLPHLIDIVRNCGCGY